MKLHRLILAAGAALLLAGCNPAPVLDAPVLQKVTVNFSVPAVNPALMEALGSGGVVTSSKALMMLTRYSVMTHDYSTGLSVTLPDVILSNVGPGGGDSSTVLQLYPGHSYYLEILGYNDGESTYSPMVYGSIDNVQIWTSGSQWISVTLRPYSPSYQDAGVGNHWNDYWTAPSIYNAGSNAFTSIGGEKWSYFNMPYNGTNTFSVSVGPSDPNALVFAGLFDAYGESVGGFAVSPSFFGGSTNVVTLEGGMTPYSTLYLGYVVILNDAVSTNLQSPDVAVEVLQPTLSDDYYENNDDTGNAFWFYPPATPGYYFSLVNDIYGNAKAYDRDCYAFTAPATGIYTVTVDSLPLAAGEVSVIDAYGQWVGSVWSDGSATQNSFTVTGLSLSSGNTYYVSVDLHGVDPNFNMPILGGEYNLTLSYY